MPFGIIGRTGPGNEASSGVWGSVTGRGTLGANMGRAIVTNGDFPAYVCDSASTVGAAVWGGACGGPRHCCIRWGPRHTTGRGGFGFFVPHFQDGKCHWLADGEMFSIRMQKLDISVRQTYRWKDRFVGFLAIYSVSRSKLGLFYENLLATTSIYRTVLRLALAMCARLASQCP